jgi:hypothetical protein
MDHVLFEKVKELLYGDVDKTWGWFTTRNSALGGDAPLDIIKHGKIKKVERYVDETIRCKRVLI